MGSMSHKILLAEDDRELGVLLRTELCLHDYEVELCEDGVAALERVLSWKPHLAILDHNMPGLDGRSVCSRLRRSGLDVRIIILTASHRIADRVAGLDAGADDYVCKPYDMDELLARVRAQLRDVPPPLVVRPAAAAAVPSGADAWPEEELPPDLASSELGAKHRGLTFRVLGDFRMMWRGTNVAGLLWNRRQPLLVLKILLANYGRIVLADVLEEALWPQLGPEKSKRSLHVTVQRLRSGLRPFGPSRIETCTGGYTLRLLPEDDLDLKQFDELVAAMSREIADPHTRASVIGRIPTLLDLYCGDLFAEEPYADWAATPRERARTAFTELLRAAASSMEARQDRVQLLRRLTELEPSDEASALDLAQCLLERGEISAAMSQLQRTRRVLREDLEVEPSPRWHQLVASARS